MALPSVRTVFHLDEMRAGRPVLRAGETGLDAQVRWVHVSEVSDIAPLLAGGELILTTGIALPESARGLRRYVRDLQAARVSGLVVELGRRYRTALPDALVDAARAAELPLLELHREIRFVAVTQAVHTQILNARMRELVVADERQQHRTLLTSLVSGRCDELTEQASGLGVPLTGRTLTGVAIRMDAASPAQLRTVANRAAETLRSLGVAALVGLIDDHHVAALLALERADAVTAVLDAVAEQVHSPGESAVLAAGPSVRGAERAALTVRDAVRVSDTAPAAHHGWVRAADLRLRGLVHLLRDNAHLRAYADRELAALLERSDSEQLLATLTAYCRAGGNKTGAAGALFVSRASLYDRLRKLARVLDVDLDDPDVVLGLHFAVLARETLADPSIAVRSMP